MPGFDQTGFGQHLLGVPFIQRTPGESYTSVLDLTADAGAGAAGSAGFYTSTRMRAVSPGERTVWTGSG